MHRLPISILGILTLTLAGTACSHGTGESQRTGQAAKGEPVTVTGCLTAGPNGTMVLTADPDEVVATAQRAASGARETFTYQLVGGQNLQEHVGKRVEVTGKLNERAGDEVELQSKSTTEREPKREGKDTEAQVESKEQIDLEVRDLQVEMVRPAAGTCDLGR
jgi:hypothetical protein